MASSNILVIYQDSARALDVLKCVTNSELEHSTWRIDNKYYTATVNFVVQTPATFLFENEDVGEGEGGEGEDGGEYPAIIYLANGSEDFQASFNDLSGPLKNVSAEVKLVVSTTYEEDDEHKVEEMDEYFSAFGLEFVGIDHDGKAPRVLDALSTIMWPTMVRKGRRTDTDISLEELQTFLDETADHEHDHPSSFLDFDHPPDDDGDDHLDIDIDNPEVLARLRNDLLLQHSKPMPGSNAYKDELDALEKWLESGDDDKDKVRWGGDHDDDGEGEEGDKTVVASSSAGGSSSSSKFGFDDDFTPFISASTSSSTDDSYELPSPPPESSHRHPEDFDLTNILQSLQHMKEEISHITNEDERRKAAARIALGLVWGLDGGKEGHKQM